MPSDKMRIRNDERYKIIERTELFILDICKQNGAHADWLIMPKWLKEAELSNRNKFNLEDLSQGMESLAKKGLVRKDMGYFFLTQLGYEAISSDSDIQSNIIT